MGISKQLYIKLGWGKFITLHHDTFKELTLEFFTTLQPIYSSNNALSCRFFGKPNEINYDTIFKVFGFLNEGLKVGHFNPAEFWRILSRSTYYLGSGALPNGMIKDHCYLILHCFMSSTIFGKNEISRVSKQELLLLWGLYNKTPINTIHFIFQ